VARRLRLALAHSALWVVSAALVWPAASQAWPARVQRVADGDTVWVERLHTNESPGKPQLVRLQGIDAPEGCQPGGDTATQALRARVLNEVVELTPLGDDVHGRLLARVHLGGHDVGRDLVLQGLAWSYRYKGDPGPYAAEEAAARQARRGLFAVGAPEPQPPRAFRQQHGRCVYDHGHTPQRP